MMSIKNLKLIVSGVLVLGLITIFVYKTKPLAADSEGFTLSPNAPQTIYQDGVPQIDKNGNRLSEYDAQKSFFPLWMYTGTFYPAGCDFSQTKPPCGPSSTNPLYNNSQYELLKQGNFNTIAVSNYF